MSGRVCGIHQEWCPTGECRWCEPLPTERTFPVPQPCVLKMIAPNIKLIEEMVTAGLIKPEDAMRLINGLG